MAAAAAVGRRRYREAARGGDGWMDGSEKRRSPCISTRTHTHTYVHGGTNRCRTRVPFLAHPFTRISFIPILPSFLPPSFLPSFILYPSSIITTTIRQQQQHRPPWQSEPATGVIVDDVHETAALVRCRRICFLAAPRPEPRVSAFRSSWGGLDEARNCSAPV